MFPTLPTHLLNKKHRTIYNSRGDNALGQPTLQKKDWLISKRMRLQTVFAQTPNADWPGLGWLGWGLDEGVPPGLPPQPPFLWKPGSEQQIATSCSGPLPIPPRAPPPCQSPNLTPPLWTSGGLVCLYMIYGSPHSPCPRCWPCPAPASGSEGARPAAPEARWVTELFLAATLPNEIWFHCKSQSCPKSHKVKISSCRFRNLFTKYQNLRLRN